MKANLSVNIALLIALSLNPCTAKDSSCKASVLKASPAKIKEKGDGYVEAIQMDNKTQNCVNYINNKRRHKYQEIARKERISLEEVEMTAAEHIREKDKKRQ